MNSLETIEDRYIQTTLLPEEDFVISPEEKIENLVRELRNQGVIEIEEREIPITFEDWIEKKEHIEKEYGATYKTDYLGGLLYSLRDQSQLILKPTNAKQEYRWEISAPKSYHDYILNRFGKIQRFDVEPQSSTNTILTSSRGEKTWIIDMAKSIPNLHSISAGEVQKRFLEAQDTMHNLTLANNFSDIHVKYMDIPVYKKGNSLRKNTYCINSLTVEYDNDYTSEKDLIGYSSLVFLALMYPFDLKNVTKRFGEQVLVKNRYQALSMGFVKTENPNKLVLPESKLSLSFERANENVTKWEIETQTQNIQNIIMFLLHINPRACSQYDTEGKAIITIPTPKSKDKNIITVSAKR